MYGIKSTSSVKAPDFGERRTHILEDIATLTGGTVISKQKGMRLDKVTFDDLGTCRGVTVEKEKTTIVDGYGTEEAIKTRLEEIKDTTKVEQSNNATEVETNFSSKDKFRSKSFTWSLIKLLKLFVFIPKEVK